jgi:glutamine amidotransferase
LITVIDYRAGNLASVQKAFAHIGEQTRLTADPQVVLAAERIVLPGVGHFSAMQRLQDSGLKTAIRDAISRGVPFLGICLGMQWLFEGSAEAPGVRGLGIFPGICQRFPDTVKSPHVGWNRVRRRQFCYLLQRVPEGVFAYYTHSYHAPITDGVVGTTTYGDAFASAVERANIFGVQFHPEKSGEAGLQMLRNFCAYTALRKPHVASQGAAKC